MKALDCYKDYNTFVKHITFIRGFFKDGEWINVEPNSKFIHIDGITREEASKLYKEEVLKRKKRLSRNKIISKILDKFKPFHLLEHVEDNKSILYLMDILKKDYINEKDLDNVLANAEYFYDIIKNKENSNNI